MVQWLAENRFKPCEKSKSIDQLKYALPIGDIIQFLVEVAVGGLAKCVEGPLLVIFECGM